MTKEQSEAIEYFMDKIKDAIPRYTEILVDGKIIKEEVYPIKMRFDQEDAEKMQTVLNMLKEKDEEIEKYKKRNKELSNQILILYKEQDNYNARIDKKNKEIKKKDKELEMYKDMKEIVDYKVTDLLKLKQYDDLKKKAEKQDKIIDLMADHIASAAIVDDTVCAIKCDCETDINEDCTHVKMLNCTKQYFERKATNDG